MEIHVSDEIHAISRFARDEAMRTGSYAIGIDHIFLGIIRHHDNEACEALTSLGIELGAIRDAVESEILASESIPFSAIDKINFSKAAQRLMSIAIVEASRYEDDKVSSMHLLLAISKCENSVTDNYLKYHAIGYEALSEFVARKKKKDAPGKESSGDESEISLEEYGTDLTALAAAGTLDPVVGRDDEINRVVEILGRRKKNNAMLVGEPGVGKSAIVESIALKIASGNITPTLKNKRLIALDITSVVAGTRFRGDFEKRLKSIIAELKAHPEIILFIDEFHTMVGAGGAPGSLDAANMLKPALARGELQCIGATTISDFSKTVKKDASLDRRFQTVMVEPMNIEQSIAVLQKLKEKYEQFHNVQYSDDAIEACVRLTDRYLTDRALPDKAIDALDETGSMVRIRTNGESHKTCTVKADDIAQTVSRMSGVPVSKVAESEGKKLMEMSKRLRSRVIGQDDAVDTVVRAIRRSRAGLKSPSRPIGSFLFLGSTGVGKTMLAKCLADLLFGSEDSLIRIDMSEYSESFTTSRLIGAPPGYVGYDEGGQLSEQILHHPYSVVLLDEIEKAHPDIFNLLLQVLDEGRLTDGNGRSINFCNTVIIMTSNAGTKEIEEYGSGVGFATTGKNSTRDRRTLIDKALRKVFPPEFLNRIDERVYFNPLNKADIERIVDLELESLRKRAAEAGYKLSISTSVKRMVAEAGLDPAYGARQLKRAVVNYIENPIAEFIITDRMNRDANVNELTTLSVTARTGSTETIVKRK